MLEAGAERVIVGTRAIEERVWLEALVEAHPGSVLVAVDALNGRVLTHGWRRDGGYALTDYLKSLEGMPLAGVLFTDVGREGRMGGVGRSTMRDAMKAAPSGLWASGGIASIEDLEFLDDTGATGAVLGMSLYTGKLDAAELARRWREVQ